MFLGMQDIATIQYGSLVVTMPIGGFMFIAGTLKIHLE